MKYQKKISRVKAVIFAAAAFLFCFAAAAAQARDPQNITDWYIKDFTSTITVQGDSSLLIEEKIVADCDSLPDKHGIFRVVPMQTNTEKGTLKMPVTLVSITDFEDNPLVYSAKYDNFNHTLAWQIGDPAKTVTGENHYKVTYTVKNAIRPYDKDLDELYWNLTGNFWDIEIDNFSAKMVFPEGVSKDNSEVSVYTGLQGDKSGNLADYEWIGSALNVKSNQILAPRQGITASVTFPKGDITAYNPGFFEKYGDYLWFLLPLMAFITALIIWFKHGKDPRIDKTVIPEFEIPEALPPMEMGLLVSNGHFQDKLISATIIDMAVKKILTIEEIAKGSIFGSADFKLTKIATEEEFMKLGAAEKTLAQKIFENGNEVRLSELKNKFYLAVPQIKKSAALTLNEKALVYQNGFSFMAGLIAIAIILFLGSFIALGSGEFILAGAIGTSGLIFLVFGLLMPKRTQKGAELNWRIKGFKLYMETAEKYRSQFNEKENIFEKFLPYAVVFGIAKLWAKKMEEIYGKEYFANYHPAWYVGSSLANFDANNFAERINSVSSGIAASTGTSSGAHGSGFSGGGGGGGGGGGW